ncbi:MAG: acyl-CoA dehydrogenase family protein [Tabrizicola sp.]|uniref:acyl-CoA dehydrogenase family protein n=1 Tax=Tabrizicola sp. TaxID=2005166 RepID=UPI001B6DA36E|nr:acyl-CoA/acyl-ACP dehydrogenase [Tabrizicola sp.]
MTLSNNTLARSPAAMGETLSEKADRLALDFATRADRHDVEGSFVAENYACLKDAGLIEAGVPAELGGGGATVAELADMLRRLAHGCGATALAFAMHTHQVAIPAWRWRNQPPAKPVVEPLLRRIAAERIVMMSSGGSDWVGGAGRAEKVEGGYRIHATKAFASGAPLGAILMTSAVAEEAGGPTVLHFGAPLNAPGVRVDEVWDAMGMRGTASQSVVFDGLFIPDDKIPLKRKAGEWHLIFQITANIAIPLIYAVYTGLAEAARDRAIVIETARPEARRSPHLAGELEMRLHATRLAHHDMVAAGMEGNPSPESVNRVMLGRALVVENALATASLAMDLAGGEGFQRRGGLERIFRDIQGARYHPMRMDKAAAYAGTLATGGDVSRIF